MRADADLYAAKAMPVLTPSASGSKNGGKLSFVLGSVCVRRENNFRHIECARAAEHFFWQAFRVGFGERLTPCPADKVLFRSTSNDSRIASRSARWMHGKIACVVAFISH